MLSSTNIARFDPVRSMLFSSITNSYTALDIPFEHPMRLLHFINGTDGDLMISFNGTDDNIPLLAGGFSLYDLTSNQDTRNSLRYVKNTQLYVKYLTAPTSGSVYVVTLYSKGE